MFVYYLFVYEINSQLVLVLLSNEYDLFDYYNYYMRSIVFFRLFELLLFLYF